MIKDWTLLFAAMAIGCSVACSQPDGVHFRSRPNLARDGVTVTMSLRQGGVASIYQLSVEGGQPRRLTSGDDVSPSVSSEERLVAFARIAPDGNQGIWVVDRRDNVERKVTRSDAHDDFPVFVDSNTVVFFRSQQPRTTSTFGSSWVDWDLFSVNLLTSAETRLTREAFYQAGPLSIDLKTRSNRLRWFRFNGFKPNISTRPENRQSVDEQIAWRVHRDPRLKRAPSLREACGSGPNDRRVRLRSVSAGERILYKGEERLGVWSSRVRPSWVSGRRSRERRGSAPARQPRAIHVFDDFNQ